MNAETITPAEIQRSMYTVAQELEEADACYQRAAFAATQQPTDKDTKAGMIKAIQTRDALRAELDALGAAQLEAARVADSAKADAELVALSKQAGQARAAFDELAEAHDALLSAIAPIAERFEALRLAEHRALGLQGDLLRSRACRQVVAFDEILHGPRVTAVALATHVVATGMHGSDWTTERAVAERQEQTARVLAVIGRVERLAVQHIRPETQQKGPQ